MVSRVRAGQGGRGAGCRRRRTGRPRRPAPSGRHLAPEELEDVRVRLDVVLADPPPAETADPDRASSCSASSPSILPSLSASASSVTGDATDRASLAGTRPPRRRSNPSRSRRNDADGRRARSRLPFGARPSGGRPRRNTIRGPIVFTSLAVLDDVDLAGRYRVERITLVALSHDRLARARRSPSPPARGAPRAASVHRCGEAAAAAGARRPVAASARSRARGSCRRAGGRTSPLSTSNTSAATDGADRRGPRRRRHQPELAEGLAAAEGADPALLRRSPGPPRPPRGRPCGRRRRRRAGPPGGTPACPSPRPRSRTRPAISFRTRPGCPRTSGARRSARPPRPASRVSSRNRIRRTDGADLAADRAQQRDQAAEHRPGTNSREDDEQEPRHGPSVPQPARRASPNTVCQ